MKQYEESEGTRAALEGRKKQSRSDEQPKKWRNWTLERCYYDGMHGGKRRRREVKIQTEKQGSRM